jgi:hypothetical protein
MQQIGQALAADEVSTAFRTSGPGNVWFRISSDTASQVVEIESSTTDASADFSTFNADGTAQSLTTDDNRMFNLPGGLYFRVVADTGNAGTVDCFVDGNRIALVE